MLNQPAQTCVVYVLTASVCLEYYLHWNTCRKFVSTKRSVKFQRNVRVKAGQKLRTDKESEQDCHLCAAKKEKKEQTMLLTGDVLN